MYELSNRENTGKIDQEVQLLQNFSFYPLFRTNPFISLDQRIKFHNKSTE